MVTVELTNDETLALATLFAIGREAVSDKLARAVDAARRSEQGEDEAAPESQADKPDPARPLSDLLPQAIEVAAFDTGTHRLRTLMDRTSSPRLGPRVQVTDSPSIGMTDTALVRLLTAVIPISQALRSIVEGTTPGASVTGEARSELVKLLCRAGVPCKV